jgi:Zn-dependent metalloprotease
MKSKIISFLLLLIIGLYAYAQEVNVTESAADGTIKFATIQNQTKTVRDENPKAFLKRILKASSGTEFYLYKIVSDELGMVHEKYQQTFNGIKIEFSEFIVHKDKSGNIVSINGDFAKIPESFNTKPKLGFNEALKKTKLNKSIGNYRILDLTSEKSV